jgi:hypothetical protein
MNVVESVIPISSLLIVIAEASFLLELIAAKEPPRSDGEVALADELQ